MQKFRLTLFTLPALLIVGSEPRAAGAEAALRTDYYAHYWLNGKYLGRSEGAFGAAKMVA